MPEPSTKVNAVNRPPDTFRRPMSVVLNDPSLAAGLSANLIIAERNEYIVSAEDSEIIGEIVNLIDAQPHLFAVRFLRLERQVEELRQRLDAAQSGIRYDEVAP